MNDTLQFTVTLEDEVEGEGVSNNVVEVPISVILIDQNDNSPVFLNVSYTYLLAFKVHIYLKKKHDVK